MSDEPAAPATAIPRVQQVIAVLWPGFLIAGVATIGVFSLIDPVEMAHCLGWEGLTRLGAYSTGFFLFWLLTAASSILTCYFQKPCEAGRAPTPKQ